MKILFGDISSYKAIVVARFLKKKYHNIKIYTFDSRKFTRTIRSKYSDEHLIINSNDINGYLNYIEKNQINLFIPVINESIKSILQHKEKFRNCLSYLGDYEIFDNLNDKKKLMSLAAKLSVQIPETYDSINEAKYPCVIKPTNLSSAKGVKYIFNQIELEKVKERYKRKENILSQEYIPGIGVGYSVFVENGKIIGGYGHKRLGEYPVSGGSSVYRESFYDDRMRIIVKKILKVLPWTGFAMFEFKLKPNDELVLIEVNPRIWGSINQGLQNGVNYFEPILGASQTITEVKKKKDIKTYLSPQVYSSLFMYLLRGKFKPTITFLSNFGNNKADISLWDDPKGWLSIILRKIL